MSEPRAGRAKRDLLYPLAAAHAGYFSVREAQQVGISTHDLTYYSRRGLITSAFRGVYRLRDFPPGDHEELVVIWLASHQEGVFSRETALQLHNLSDVLPNLIHVSLLPTWRRRLLPEGVERHYIKAPITQHSWVGDVPVTTPLRTLTDCMEAHVSPELVQQAIKQARARGLIGPDELDIRGGKYATHII